MHMLENEDRLKTVRPNKPISKTKRTADQWKKAFLKRTEENVKYKINKIYIPLPRMNMRKREDTNHQYQA